MTELAQILQQHKGKGELVGHLQSYLRESFINAGFSPNDYYDEIQDLAEIESAIYQEEFE